MTDAEWQEFNNRKFYPLPQADPEPGSHVAEPYRHSIPSAKAWCVRPFVGHSYLAIFQGPEAEALAREYAAWRNTDRREMPLLEKTP